MATKPFSPRAFLAAVTATVQPLIRAYAFLPARVAFLLTILPRLFFCRSVFFKPLKAFTLVPLNTADFASLPLAITDFTFFIAFMAFIAFAMADKRKRAGGKVAGEGRAAES